jgi:hypothetical protein
MEPISPSEERDSSGAGAAPGSAPANGGEAVTQKLPALSPAGAGAQAPTTQVMTSPPATPGAPSAAVQPSAPARSAAPSTTPLTPALASSGREQCAVCACPVAPDQRYCVECGQRLAPARPTLMSDPSGRGGAETPPPKRKSRFDWGPNATLIAGIATLLLALGVGVIIGHYSASGSPKKATPIVVSGLGATGGVGTTAATGTTAGAAGAAGAGKGGAKSTGGGGGSGHPTQAASKPPNPTVQLGQKGHGQGYQHGEFTGHFFGGENEEDAGEEGEEESSGGGKKHK